MRLFLTFRVLKRNGFLLLGGGTMKKVVMLFSLKKKGQCHEIFDPTFS